MGYVEPGVVEDVAEGIARMIEGYTPRPNQNSGGRDDGSRNANGSGRAKMVGVCHPAEVWPP